jgi:hypothetical protein
VELVVCCCTDGSTATSIAGVSTNDHHGVRMDCVVRWITVRWLNNLCFHRSSLDFPIYIYIYMICVSDAPTLCSKQLLDASLLLSNQCRVTNTCCCTLGLEVTGNGLMCSVIQQCFEYVHIAVKPQPARSQQHPTHVITPNSNCTAS